MEFTCNAADTNDWKPVTHDYEVNVNTSWSASGNVITVTNHSNTAVNAAFAYTKAAGFESVIGAFSNASLPLATAVGTAVGSAPSGTTTLTLSGTLANPVADFTKVATITVTLS